jgi:hypothetical protein
LLDYKTKYGKNENINMALSLLLEGVDMENVEIVIEE